LAEEYLFKGRVLNRSIGNNVVLLCYDLLAKLNKEHIPPDDGYYIATDVGLIIRDVVHGSKWDISISGVKTSTGIIVAQINLTDKSRLDALKLLLYIANSNPKNEVYHFYMRGDELNFGQLPTYNGGDAVLSIDETNVIGTPKISYKGSEYYNCCTVVGADNIRSYYPGTTDDNGVMISDFPDEAEHKLISDNSIANKDVGYQIARGFVKSHNVIDEPIINVTVSVDRIDYFQGQPIDVDLISYGIFGQHVIKSIKYIIGPGSKIMATFKLSNIKEATAGTLIKRLG